MTNKIQIWIVILLAISTSVLQAQDDPYAYLLERADKAINADDPESALIFYNEIYDHAKAQDSAVYQRIALFRIARMHFWLGDYDTSAEIYEFLLASILDATDYQIALAGLMNSLSYDNKPFMAYHIGQIKNPEKIDQQDLILANARAALWSNKPFAAEQWLVDADLDSNIQLQNLEFFTAQESAAYVIEPYFRYEHDTDDLTIYKTGVKASHRWNAQQSSSVLAAYHQYSQYDKVAHGEMVGVSQIMHLFDKTVHLGIGLNAVDFNTGWSPWTGLIDLFYQAEDEWAFNVYADKSLVDTYLAVENEITVDAYGVDLFYLPNYRTTFTLSPYYKHFSDGNDRMGVTASSDILLWPSFGFGIRPQMRYFEDSAQIANNSYFNPSEYAEANLFLTLERWLLPTVSWYIEAGPGYQNTHPGEDGPTYLVEGGISGAINEITYVSAFVGYNNASYSSASGYSNTYGGIAVTIAFD